QSNLRGIEIPRKLERLIATFFANDTTIYLSSEDDFGDLTKILDEWCLASGAKFNISKTEIMPIGTKDHQESVRLTRLLNGETGTKIPEHVWIAQEGEAICTLGALIGNGICQIQPWTKVLEKIDTSLNQWNQSHPTLEGRRLIIQMVIGGMTQYLTKVQGMPKEIEEKLVKRIKQFFWDNKTNPQVNRETIEAPINEGGYQLLDIMVRNEAIVVTWLQSYLDFSENRATWAYVADALIAHHIPKSEMNIENRDKINIFLQSWRTDKSKLPTDLQNLLTIAEKYGVRMEGLAFSQDIIRQMPIWLCIEAVKL
ncbi:hypothetical protein F5051DRAFT_338259, partial [Lentinula edodes]